MTGLNSLSRQILSLLCFCLFSLPLPAVEESIVLNEILFKEASGNQEWVEIYNRGASIVTMENYSLIDAANNRTQFTGIINPQQYVVICRHKDRMLEYYPYIEAGNVIESTSWAILNNDKERIYLIDNDGAVIDSMSYTASASYPHDYSLERINPYSNEPEWKQSIHPDKSTPTFPNSHLPLEFDLQVVETVSERLDDDIEHRIVVRNRGYRLIESFEIQCFAYYGNKDAHLIYYAGVTNQDQESVTVFNTDIPESEYTTYEYCLLSEKDMDISNNHGVSFINNNALPAVVNEIMFRTGDNRRKWLEIYINKRYKHLDSMTLNTQRESVTFSIGNSDYLLITNSAADSLSLIEEYNLIDIPIYTGLSNLLTSGEELILKDPSGNIIENFTYNPEWSTGRDVSIERINPALSATDDNWGHSIAPQGSTAGYQNSIYTLFIPPTASLEISPNPFSPTKGENTIISFKFPEGLTRVTCRILDLKGRLVNTAINQQIQGSAGSIIWNGYKEDGRKLPIGVYIVAIEATGYDSEVVYKEQKTVVIAK